MRKLSVHLPEQASNIKLAVKLASASTKKQIQTLWLLMFFLTFEPLFFDLWTSKQIQTLWLLMFFLTYEPLLFDFWTSSSKCRQTGFLIIKLFQNWNWCFSKLKLEDIAVKQLSFAMIKTNHLGVIQKIVLRVCSEFHDVLNAASTYDVASISQEMVSFSFGFPWLQMLFPCRNRFWGQIQKSGPAVMF